MQSAAKVGLLLVIFVGLLIAGYSVLGKSLFAPPMDVYYANISDASGVSEGTQVLIAGVNVGTVTKITLKSPTLARLTLSIAKGTGIPDGSMVLLPTSLIGFGESPLTIVPPEPSTVTMLSPGSTLQGKKFSALDSFLPEGKQTIAELNRTMVAVRKLLEDQKLQNKVSDLLVTSNKTIERFGTLANDASHLIATNQSNIAAALQAATAAVQDVHKVTTRVAELVQSGKLQKDAVAIMDKVKTISEHANDLIVSMNQLINDPKLRDPINRSAANVADITNTGKEIAGNTAQITKNGISISENAAVVSKKAIALTDKAAEIATKASEIEDQLKGVLDKVGGFFNKAPSSRDIPKITTEMDLMRQSQPGYWRTDVGFTVPLSDYTLNLGIYDALETNRFTIELGKPLTDRFSYRYGIYASKPAIGVDYRLAPKLSLRGDAWDINDSRLDLRASYEFGNGLIGWLGMDRVLKDNAITFGVGVRR
jgi:phospholipid/cholesterol/gamma-HCH transport system substrate-binding protein